MYNSIKHDSKSEINIEMLDLDNSKVLNTISSYPSVNVNMISV